MKKIIAVILAMVMAFSMSAVAFAADNEVSNTYKEVPNTCPHCSQEFYDEGEYNTHLTVCNIKTCTKCGEVFANEGAYNDHVTACTEGDETDYINITVADILTAFVDVIKSIMEQWDGVEDIVIRTIDFIESIMGVAGGEEAAEAE